MRRTYQALLRLYPPDWRELFGREMARVFAEAAEDHRLRGPAVRYGFLCSEFSGLITGAFGEWRRVPVRHWRRTRPPMFPLAITAITGLAAVALLQAPHLQQSSHSVASTADLATLLVGSAIVIAVLTFFLACQFQRSIRTSRRRAESYTEPRPPGSGQATRYAARFLHVAPPG